jgi:hypothetical protein
MVLFAAFATQVGALNTTPVLLTVVTSFVIVQTVQRALTRRTGKAADVSAADKQPPGDPSVAAPDPPV